jgi:hypothetical protein
VAPRLSSVVIMLTMYADAWHHLPSSAVDQVCGPSFDEGDAAKAPGGPVEHPDPGRERDYGLRQTETWLSLSEVNSRRSQSA